MNDRARHVGATGESKAFKGFTLVELLVVVGIIALLVSILLPTLSRARASAVTVQCLSNMRQIGQVAYIYSTEYKGYLPPAKPDAIEVITGGNPLPTNPLATFHRNKENFFRLLKGGTQVFYCPANYLWDQEGDGGQHDPKWFKEPFITKGTAQENGADVRIRYWYMADPWQPDDKTLQGPNPPKGYTQFLDINNNGTSRDEYVKKAGEKNASRIVIMTDQSRQASNQFGFAFLHGGGASKHGWVKNNLYGDLHAESLRPDQLVWRYGPTNAAYW